MQFRSSAPARLIRAALAALAIGSMHSVRAAPLTLEEAWRIAEMANPALRIAQSAVPEAQGQLAAARALLWNNPALSLEGWRKRTPDAAPPGDRENDWRAAISQPLEIAGQQERRRVAAESELAAVEANIMEARVQVRADVEEHFVQVLALQVRATVEQETMAIIDQAAVAMMRRLDAGEVNRLDANLARVEAERARNALTQVDGELTQARAELARALQLPPAELPEVAGKLQRESVYALDELLAAALQRQRLQSLARRETAARSRLELERAARYPDLTVGIFTGREGPSDLRENIVGMTLSMPLPLFRRNEEGIGRAVSELTQLQIQRQAAERDALAAVRAQWRRVAQLEQRVQRLHESVLRPLEENQRLSQRALHEGEIGIAELLLANRQVAEVKREALDAEAELRRARIALERAAGWLPIDMRGKK